jgi:large subunit ribosomal protein L3
MNTILGTKIKQTQQFTENGTRIPVTFVSAGPCYITEIREIGKGKNIQIGYGIKKHQNKAVAGHLKKAGITLNLRFLRSIKSSSTENVTLGQELNVTEILQPGDAIAVTGISKGKGFAGVVKRHGFHGGPRTHGQSDRERSPGSIGQTTTPGRVYRGKRMAGRMGNERVTVRHLQVVAVNKETNLLTVKGLVPGPAKGLLLIKKEG